MAAHDHGNMLNVLWIQAMQIWRIFVQGLEGFHLFCCPKIQDSVRWSAHVLMKSPCVKMVYVSMYARQYRIMYKGWYLRFLVSSSVSKLLNY